MALSMLPDALIIISLKIKSRLPKSFSAISLVKYNTIVNKNKYTMVPTVTVMPFFVMPSKNIAAKFLSFNFEISSSFAASLII